MAWLLCVLVLAGCAIEHRDNAWAQGRKGKGVVMVMT